MLDTFTSTGAKFFAHQDAMANLRNGRGQPITTHVMLTDVCNHKCAFCSVQKRAGDSLPFDVVLRYIDTLLQYGLKSVILSGGGNPILYRRFNDVVDELHSRGLEIGLITNGMPMKAYNGRTSWKAVRPETLDKLAWVRVSMAGLDHDEGKVYVPDIDQKRTTLGFSYVAHDVYWEPSDPYHGKVSTQKDLLSEARPPDWSFDSRFSALTAAIDFYIELYNPRYVRLLPNCLEPDKIADRCSKLQAMADELNRGADREVAFVQNKPPKAPKACYLGYIHPVLNTDGYVYPCDSCVLNDAADHQFANPWRVCRWDEVAQLYEQPVRSLITDPGKTCPGCVFHRSNALLGAVVDGTADLTPPSENLEHRNFV